MTRSTPLQPPVDNSDQPNHASAEAALLRSAAFIPFPSSLSHSLYTSSCGPMTTQSHNTPLARLSRIGLALGIGSSQATRNNSSKGEDESYIPYNGPYESPAGGQRIHGYWDGGVQGTTIDAHSFSRFSSGEEKGHASYNQTSSFSNRGKYSDVSRVTLPNIVTEPRRMFGRIRQNSTPPLRASFLSLDKGGGVGDTPVPAHRSTPSQSGSSLKVSPQPFYSVRSCIYPVSASRFALSCLGDRSSQKLL